MTTTPPAPTRSVTPPRPQPTTATTAQTPVPPGVPPKPKGDLDRRTLLAAGTFGVLLRNGQTWQRVELLDMDQWSLLLETERGRVLLPKHAVDAYLLDSA